MATLNPLLSQRRSAIEIVYEILKVCDNGRNNKTAIMYQSNLNHDQVKRYLQRLSKQYLIHSDALGYYHLTGYGKQAYEQVMQVMGILRELGREAEPAAVAD